MYIIYYEGKLHKKLVSGLHQKYILTSDFNHSIKRDFIFVNTYIYVNYNIVQKLVVVVLFYVITVPLKFRNLINIFGMKIYRIKSFKNSKCDNIETIGLIKLYLYIFINIIHLEFIALTLYVYIKKSIVIKYLNYLNTFGSEKGFKQI